MARRCFRASLTVAGIVLLVALGAAGVRLLPWLLAREVPLEVSWPFARALGAVAIETAFLVGVPLGYAIGTADFVERGEARALFALGATPFNLVVRSAGAALVLGAVAFGASLSWGSDASSPGRFAAKLIQQGKLSCSRARAARSVAVPLVGVTWLCFPERKPRIVGALPGAAERAWFTASDLEPSDDLRSFGLRDLRLSVRGEPDSARLLFRLNVAEATVFGLSPWGRPTALPLTLRALLTALTGSGLGLLTAWLLLSRAVKGRVAASVLAAIPALVALALLHALDRSADRALVYLLVPATTLAAVLVSNLGFRVGAGALARLAPALGER